MGATLENFEQLFDSTILARARGYFNAGRVSSIDHNEPLLHATVDGTNLYDVDIRVKGDVIASVACTCPYEKSPYCKHVGAVLYAIREEEKNALSKSPDAEQTKLPRTTYNRVLSYLEKQQDESSKDKQGDLIRKKNANGKVLTLGETHKIITASIKDFDRRKHPSPFANDDAMQGVYEVTDRAAKMHDAIQAVAVVLVAAELTVDFFATHDDSAGIAGDAFEALLLLLKELNEEIAATKDEAACLEIFTSINKSFVKEVFDGWYVESNFLEACLPLTICQPVRAQFELLLDVLIHEELLTRPYLAGSSFLRLWYLSMRLNGDPKAEKFANDHVDDQYFLDIVVQKAFLAHDYTKVKRLIKKQLEELVRGRYVFYSSDLSSDIFPHGWWTYLEAISEFEEDVGALLDIYQAYVVEGNDSEYIERIKQLSGDEWPTRRGAIVAAFIDATRPSEAFEALLRKETLVYEAMAYCVRFPSRTPDLCQVFASKYPLKAKQLLVQLIDEKSLYTTGRVEYRAICSIIQRYKNMFGAQEASVIVDGLLAKYRQRRAMKEELELMRGSWD